MGILGSIKNRIMRRRDEDFSDLRSNVLNESVRDPLMARNAPFQPPPPDMEPWKEPLPGPPSFDEPLSFNEPMPEKEPLDIGDERTQREIVDRLAFIENQLSAIKSQTETINERLKNMDMKIDRRYR
ncbi:MAG: hypothetical protein HZB66_00900 [Candidatus Aenigmarchaeota archaeon]|nr:hypothetical protein [Candidatus Aenigmarchaeota archaeon]